jgi:uncharacterized protein YacL
MKIKKYYLIFAFVSVSIIGMLYGVCPKWFVSTFLEINDLNPNLAHIFRAVMCLYISLGLFWLYSAFNDDYRNVALITVLIFAGGLVIGRIISFFIDGQPAPILTLYIVMEFTLVPITFWIYKLKG